MNAHTFNDILRTRAVSKPFYEELYTFENLYTFIRRPFSQNEEIQRCGYAGLDLFARDIAVLLQIEGVQRGDRVLLLYPPGLDLIYALFGCFYAGAIAVLLPPPRGAHHERLQALFRDAQPTRVLAPREVCESARAILPDAKFIDDRDSIWLGGDYRAPKIEGDDIALLQYTSGSTGNPKGVMISHANLLHNCALIQKTFRHDETSKGVIWLPPYHDMGLIGGILQPLFCGFPVTLFAPEEFLMRPARWLQLISSTQATTSGGPNFAYQLCAQKISDEQKSALDLSSWRVAFCGAEPVRSTTLENFARAFESCGFERNAFLPCYGLAETTLLATGAKPENAAPRVLEQNGHAFVSCGAAPEETGEEAEIAIVDPGTSTRASASGEVWIASPSVARGYWNQSAATCETFENFLSDGSGPFLKTGDLGFLDEGELFISGRLKDLIISGARKHHPEDIENSVLQAIPALRACAAFSVDDTSIQHDLAGNSFPNDGREKIIVAVEVPHRDAQNSHTLAGEMRAQILAAVAARHDLRVDEVLVLRPNSLPRTPSGKIMRHRCGALYLENSFVL
jgi:acyl-CoA synthetase (AMP-forming)/AMP-acid ligase II